MDLHSPDNPAVILGRLGPESLSHAQLLTLVISGGRAPTPRESSAGVQLATRYAHPARLDRASLGELTAMDGVGQVRAARIKAALELGKRSLSPLASRPRLTNSREVADYFGPRIGNREVEVFCCALLDTRNRLIRDVTVATGTVNACFIHPREVFRAAIAESACAVILVHNHPSGEMQPSDEDVSLTRKIREAGAVVGIRVLDHVIIGPGEHFSFLDGGLLAI